MQILRKQNIYIYIFMRSLSFLTNMWSPLACYYSKGVIGIGIIVSFLYGFHGKGAPPKNIIARFQKSTT
jgi:hypothetical protein